MGEGKHPTQANLADIVGSGPNPLSNVSLAIKCMVISLLVEDLVFSFIKINTSVKHNEVRVRVLWFHLRLSVAWPPLCELHKCFSFFLPPLRWDRWCAMSLPPSDRLETAGIDSWD